MGPTTTEIHSNLRNNSNDRRYIIFSSFSLSLSLSLVRIFFIKGKKKGINFMNGVKFLKNAFLWVITQTRLADNKNQDVIKCLFSFKLLREVAFGLYLNPLSGQM